MRDPHLNWKQMHHAYIGIGIALVGFYFIVQVGWLITGWIFVSVGVLIFLEDCYQHTRQWFQSGYRSPLHKIYGHIYRWYKCLRS